MKMTFSRSVLFGFMVLCLPLIAGCGGADTAPETESSAKAQRLMTAPDLQQSIQRAQEASSLSELYADGEAPDITRASPVAEKPESEPLDDTSRTIADVANDAAQDSEQAATSDPLDVSQSNPQNTPEEQARTNAARAANQAPAQAEPTSTHTPNNTKTAPQNTQGFYILGEVRTPGTYSVVQDMDVFKALAIAGGLTPNAVQDEFIIYRGVGQNRQTINANVHTLVLPGDSIKVKSR